MKHIPTIARILLGLLFLAAGLSGFIFLKNPPPAPPGLAGDFQRVFFASHWVLFVDAVEFACGLLLIANRAAAFSLVVLAAVIWNIIAFHVLMMPAGLPVAVVVFVLWIAAAMPHRRTLLRLLNE